MFNFIMKTLRLDQCQTEHPFVNTAFSNYNITLYELCKIIGRVRVDRNSDFKDILRISSDQTFKVLNPQKVFFYFFSTEIFITWVGMMPNKIFKTRL